MFLPIFQKQFSHSLEKVVKEFFPKNTFPPEKSSGHLKCRVDISVKQYFAKSAMAIAPSPKRGIGEIYFLKRSALSSKMSPWASGMAFSLKCEGNFGAKHNLFLEVQKEKKTKSAPEIISPKNSSGHPDCDLTNMPRNVRQNFVLVAQSTENATEKTFFFQKEHLF